MAYHFWIIVTLITGLASPHSRSFSLVVEKNGTKKECRVYHESGNSWTARYPGKAPGDTVSVQYVVSADNMEFTSPYIKEKISLPAYFKVKKADWKKVKKLAFKKKYKDEGETDMIVNRGRNSVSLFQDKGSFSAYSNITASWQTASPGSQ